MMTNIKLFFLTTLFSVSALSQATNLTLYTTSWSVYGKNAYQYDGAYRNDQPYGHLIYINNPDMVKQFNQADVIAWSFFQVWNDKDPNQSQYSIPHNWNGLMHFDDLWGELPFEASWLYFLPKETQAFLDFCKANEGSCSSVQINGNTGVKRLFNYADRRGVGQLNSFGAFINSDKYTAKRIIAIGGANTLGNQGISTATFDAIFNNQDKFLTQFKSWMIHFKNLRGIDYDFEPPIDLKTGTQLEPSEKTMADYKNLLNLVKASRKKLGQDAYISVTITVNKAYLEKINQSVSGGWFKDIAPWVNAVNLMTYDLHGAWSHDGDPYTAVHAYIKQPQTAHKDDFAVNYGTDDVINQVLGYGLPKEKLQVGIAAYGRGFAKVEAGSNQQLPGFEQPWSGPSLFSNDYTVEEGLMPYSSINKIIKDLGYQSYDIIANDDFNRSFVTGSYLYHPVTKQFIGYQSPQSIKALCQLIKDNKLHGSIMWSADMDLPVSSPDSLIKAYRSFCS